LVTGASQYRWSSAWATGGSPADPGAALHSRTLCF
jgi:hypothetical protein